MMVAITRIIHGSFYVNFPALEIKFSGLMHEKFPKKYLVDDSRAT